MTIAIRKRTDLDTPTSEAEAIMLVHDLLSHGAMVEVLSVTPEKKDTQGETTWG